MFALINRHHKLFRRDKTLVFFSMLSVLIMLILYIAFLQKMQVDRIEQIIQGQEGIKVLVNEWMVAGILSIMGVTTTLSVLGLYIKDRESGVFQDFLSTPSKAAKLQLSYVINGFFVGMIFSLVGLLLCELFLVLIGGELLSFAKLVKVLGIITIGVLASTVINCVLILFVNSTSAFSTLGTIVGTVIGFLCGVYVPMGVLPNFVQQIILAFPISHYTVLLRQIMMEDSLATVFGQEEAAQSAYEETYGIVFEWNNQAMTTTASITYLIVTTVVLALIALFFFKKQHRV